MLSTLRVLYHEELKILQTIAAWKPTARDPGCPKAKLQEAVMPAPAFQDIVFLLQSKVIEEPTAPQGHKYQDRFVLTVFGKELLADYSREDGPKSEERPGIAKEKAEVLRPGQPRGEPMMRLAPTGVEPPPAEALVNHAGQSKATQSVKGKGGVQGS